MTTPYVGEIRMFAGNYAPAGWALCYGQLMTIQSYDALYALLGTRYGGDGNTTFALPDLRGRAALGFGQGAGLSPHVLGEKAGLERVSLQTSHLPTHSHEATVEVTASVEAYSANGTLHVPTTGATLAAGYYPGSPSSQAEPIEIYAPAGTAASVPLGGVSATPPTPHLDGAGGSVPHDNMQPYTTINFIIALDGIWPPRN